MNEQGSPNDYEFMVQSQNIRHASPIIIKLFDLTTILLFTLFSADILAVI